MSVCCAFAVRLTRLQQPPHQQRRPGPVRKSEPRRGGLRVGVLVELAQQVSASLPIRAPSFFASMTLARLTNASRFCSRTIVSTALE